MDRRNFIGIASLTAGSALAAPTLFTDQAALSDSAAPSEMWTNPTSRQLAALRFMEENKPPSWIFEKVATEVPQLVPDEICKESWKFGSFRIIGMIGDFSSMDFRNGLVYNWKEYRPKDAEIRYVALWRQAVQNKCNRRNLQAFASTVPYGWAHRITPGQNLEIDKYIAIGTSNEEIARMARESLLKLQEVAMEHYQAQA